VNFLVVPLFLINFQEVHTYLLESEISFSVGNNISPNRLKERLERKDNIFVSLYVFLYNESQKHPKRTILLPPYLNLVLKYSTSFENLFPTNEYFLA